MRQNEISDLFQEIGRIDKSGSYRGNAGLVSVKF